MNQCITGIDIGTGSTKAVAVNVEGKVLAVAQYYYSTNSPQAGYSEQDPEIIWKAFKNCIDEIIHKTRDCTHTISFSSAMHSLLVMDSKNIAITPLITWADTRSENIAEALRQSAYAEELYSQTGTPIHSMSPLCKIKWIKENEPGIFKKAYKFISIKEFIWYRLFNDYQVDYSIASGTGLFNNTNFEWNTPSLEFCGISESHLSALVPTDLIRDDLDHLTAEKLNIPGGTSFCIGAGDGCLANVGSYVTEKGIAALTIGTSGAVRITSATQVVNYEAMIFNYVLDKKTFISGGPVNNGGNVLKWLFQAFLNKQNPSETDYDSFFKSVETVSPGSNGLLFLPYLYGERSPVWDEKASGAFFGIKSYHTNIHFLRAALEGICFALKNILEIIETSTNPITQLNVSGGFVHSEVWMHLLADVSGKKICLRQKEDASSFGAALFYMKASHMIVDYASIKPFMNDMIEPDDRNHSVYEKYYRVFKALYDPLKESMHQLHDIESSALKS